jgi:hypothetical protein
MSDENPASDQTDKPSDRITEIKRIDPGNPPDKTIKATNEFQDVKEELGGYERSTLRWTIVIVCINALTCVFISLQWHEMKSGSVDTHALADAAKKQSEKMSNMSDAADKIRQAAQDMVIQDQRIADNARNSLDASNRQSQAALDATVKNFQRDQRAWLGVSDDTYSIAETGPETSSAIVLNTGKSPAIDILCRITGTTKLKGDDLRDSDIIYPPGLLTLEQGTIFPNQHFPLNAGGPSMEVGAQKIWFENVQSGAWIQYFFGELRYKDVFGNDHWTHFCTQFVPATKNGTPCPIYNDTDDGQKSRVAVLSRSLN